MKAFLFIFLCFFMVLSPQAMAQNEPCNADFETVMNVRAWMQAQQDTEMAQTLILKPDSVLEYSCFSQKVDAVGAQVNLMFSDALSDKVLFTGEPPDFKTTSDTDVSLDNLVSTPTFTYIANNFGHVYGGGTYSGIPPSGVGCVAMDAVFSFLKCKNFSSANFKAFQDFAKIDPRLNPEPCANVAARLQRWSAAVPAAETQPGTEVGTGAGVDPFPSMQEP